MSEEQSLELLKAECARAGLREHQMPTMNVILRAISTAIQQERAAVVAWLREMRGWATDYDYDALSSIIGAIERGDHLREQGEQTEWLTL